MDRETASKLWPVIKAFSEGETVQFRRWTSKGKWDDAEYGNPGFRTDEYEYRIKPKPLEVWMNIYARHDPFRYPHDTKEEADKLAIPDRIDCIRMVQADD